MGDVVHDVVRRAVRVEVRVHAGRDLVALHDGVFRAVCHVRHHRRDRGFRHDVKIDGFVLIEVGVCVETGVEGPVVSAVIRVGAVADPDFRSSFPVIHGEDSLLCAGIVDLKTPVAAVIVFLVRIIECVVRSFRIVRVPDLDVTGLDVRAVGDSGDVGLDRHVLNVFLEVPLVRLFLEWETGFRYVVRQAVHRRVDVIFRTVGFRHFEIVADRQRHSLERLRNALFIIHDIVCRTQTAGFRNVHFVDDVHSLRVFRDDVSL